MKHFADECVNPSRFHDIASLALGGNSIDLQAFDGARIRARHLLQSFPEGVVVDSPIDHTMVFHVGGEIGVERYKNGKLDTKLQSLKTTTIIKSDEESTWRADTEVNIIHFYIDDSVLRQFAEEDLGIDGNQVEVLDLMGVDDPFMKLFTPLALEEMKSKYRSSKMMLESFDTIIVGHLLRAYSNFADHASPILKSEIKYKEDALIAKACSYMKERLSENIGLSEIASYVGLSNFHFARTFKSSLGQSPHQYLLSERLSRARDLLANSIDPISDIAYNCGFSSQSHMTSTFRKKFGVTPKEYRSLRWN